MVSAEVKVKRMSKFKENPIYKKHKGWTQVDLRIWIYDHKMKTRDVSAFIFQLFRVKPTSLQHVKIMQTKKTEQLSKIKY